MAFFLAAEAPAPPGDVVLPGHALAKEWLGVTVGDNQEAGLKAMGWKELKGRFTDSGLRATMSGDTILEINISGGYSPPTTSSYPVFGATADEVAKAFDIEISPAAGYQGQIEVMPGLFYTFHYEQLVTGVKVMVNPAGLRTVHCAANR